MLLLQTVLDRRLQRPLIANNHSYNVMFLLRLASTSLIGVILAVEITVSRFPILPVAEDAVVDIVVDLLCSWVPRETVLQLGGDVVPIECCVVDLHVGAELAFRGLCADEAIDRDRIGHVILWGMLVRDCFVRCGLGLGGRILIADEDDGVIAKRAIAGEVPLPSLDWRALPPCRLTIPLDRIDDLAGAIPDPFEQRSLDPALIDS